MLWTTRVDVKAEFLSEKKGIDWLWEIVVADDSSPDLLWKAFILIHDFLSRESDPNLPDIMYNPTLVKDCLIEKPRVLDRLVDCLTISDDAQICRQHSLWEFALLCLQDLASYSEKVLTSGRREVLEARSADISALLTRFEGDSAESEFLNKEGVLIELVLKGDK